MTSQSRTLDTAREDNSKPPTTAGGAPCPSWHARFLSMVPAIRQHAEICFRGLGGDLRQELIQEVVARSLCDYLRLRERGKEHVAQAGPLARFSVAAVKQGRRVGRRRNVRDVGSKYCRYRNGIKLQSLGERQVNGSWCEILTDCRRWTPADAAAARLDIREWLTTLPDRTRELAERLALGESTQNAARLFGISCGRVSQLRRALEHGWRSFQGELPSTDCSL
jgi:hypothetical protein